MDSGISALLHQEFLVCSGHKIFSNNNLDNNCSDNETWLLRGCNKAWLLCSGYRICRNNNLDNDCSETKTWLVIIHLSSNDRNSWRGETQVLESPNMLDWQASLSIAFLRWDLNETQLLGSPNMRDCQASLAIAFLRWDLNETQLLGSPNMRDCQASPSGSCMNSSVRYVS